MLGLGRRTQVSDREASAKRRAALPGMGALIGIGAGFGSVLGVILGNLVMGMLAGAALGTVAGAVVETLRRDAAKRDG